MNLSALEEACSALRNTNTPPLKYIKWLLLKGKSSLLLLNNCLHSLELQKHLIMEVVEPKTRAEDLKGVDWAQLAESIIDPIERDALGEVVCAQSIIIDGRPFGRIKIGDTQTYT